MKFREHRGGYAEAMQTVVQVRSFRALLKHLNTINKFGPLATRDNVTIKPYGGIDPRNGWDTHIVSITGYGVLGFTDGQFKKGTKNA